MLSVICVPVGMNQRRAPPPRTVETKPPPSPRPPAGTRLVGQHETRSPRLSPAARGRQQQEAGRRSVSRSRRAARAATMVGRPQQPRRGTGAAGPARTPDRACHMCRSGPSGCPGPSTRTGRPRPARRQIRQRNQRKQRDEHDARGEMRRQRPSRAEAIDCPSQIEHGDDAAEGIEVDANTDCAGVMPIRCRISGSQKTNRKMSMRLQKKMIHSNVVCSAKPSPNSSPIGLPRATSMACESPGDGAMARCWQQSVNAGERGSARWRGNAAIWGARAQ